MNSRAKQEDDPSDINKTSKTPSTSSRQWAGFRNPRIVRVSRTFGGKDRHSKVCTVKGLRDRRIRLSVPTAIQLYGLQDKLGLSQPSKVVDWLLEATKTDIDKLPPLQMPPGNFMTQFLQPLSSLSNNPQSSSLPHHHNFFNNDNNNASSSIKINDQGNQEGISGYEAQNLFPTSNIQSSFPNFMNTCANLPYNTNYYNLEPNSNLSLSQFGNNSFPNQQEDNSHMNYNSSSMAIPSGSQIYLPPFPPYTAMELSANDPRQINHFQFLSSSSQHVLPNPLMPTLHLISSPLKSLSLNVHSQESDNNERDKGGNGS